MLMHSELAVALAARRQALGNKLQVVQIFPEKGASVMDVCVD